MAMEENRPLSQEEIDALLAGMAQAAPEAPSSPPAEPPAPQTPQMTDEAPAAARPDDGVRPWDFKQSTRFTPDVVRAISRVMEQSHLMIQTMLPASFRSPVTPKTPDIVTLSFERYSTVPKDRGISLTIVSDRLAAPILLMLDEMITAAILDRELGGQGAPGAMTRTLSPLELQVLFLASDNFVKVVEATFQLAIPELKLSCERVVASSQLQNVVPPTESLLWIKQPIAFGAHTGYMHIVLPYMSIEPVLPNIVTWQAGWSSRGSEVQDVDGLSPALAVRPVVVEVALAPISLTVGQLHALEPGDIIVTPHKVSDGFWVTVEGRPTYWGKTVGKVGPRLAILVERVIP